VDAKWVFVQVNIEIEFELFGAGLRAAGEQQQGKRLPHE
jgi:hypothetical protein